MNLDTLPDLDIVGGFPRDIFYVWKYDSVNIDNWPIMAEPDSAVWQIALAIGNVDGDGQLEIVAIKWQGGEYHGLLYVFHKDGSIMQGFPVRFKGMKTTAPALYDLKGTGN